VGEYMWRMVKRVREAHLSIFLNSSCNCLISDFAGLGLAAAAAICRLTATSR